MTPMQPDKARLDRGCSRLWTMSLLEILELVVVGLAAGVLGGLLGIGGSILMIPALGLILGLDQHLAQASAMIVNVFVAIPALLRHRRAGAVRWDVFWRMLPAALLFILIGVEASNRFEGRFLHRVFGVFLLYVILVNVHRLIRRAAEPPAHEQRPGWITAGPVGAIMGFAAGLLGIGGGGIAVPMLQRICNLPLRQCIATSTAVMCITAGVGAARKNMSLSALTAADGAPLGLSADQSLVIAACLAPTALLGGFLGAHLTHALPLKWIRIAFILLMAWASMNMLLGR